MMSTNLAQPSTLDSGLIKSMGSMPGSETFLPFGSTMSYDTSSTLNADLEVDHGRQASLLKLMNGDRGDVSMGTHGGASGDQGLRSLGTFGNGFLFPSRDPLPTSLPESSSTGGYQPFASIEMSLAAAANQCPVLEDDPKYDFVELAIQSSDFANKKRFDALEGHHSHRGDGHQGQGQEKKNRGRHGRTRILQHLGSRVTLGTWTRCEVVTIKATVKGKGKGKGKVKGTRSKECVMVPRAALAGKTAMLTDDEAPRPLARIRTLAIVDVKSKRVHKKE
ncbi:hypothetical protein BG005_009702 [Podila minutissima]|nr:hypothetical protein BG005_009702 [Podila minutissima]